MRFPLALLVVAVLAATSAPGAAGDPGSTVSAIASTATTQFVDVTTIGQPAGTFTNRWIRFATTSNPDGFITRVKSFDPATGTFTVYDTIPQGLVKAADTYHVADAPDGFPALAPTQSTTTPAEVGCAPTGTASDDSVTCSGADTTGVAAGDGNDSVTVTPAASVSVTSVGVRSPSALAVELAEGADTVTNEGGVTASAFAIVTPVLIPPSPVPGASKVWAAAVALGPTARGIDGGPGDDSIQNDETGQLSASSVSVLLPGVVPSTVVGFKSADVSSTASASATAVAAAAGNDTVSNGGVVSSSSSATALGVSLLTISEPAIGKKSSSTVKGNVTADAKTTGVSGGDGSDEVANDATVTATASAFSLAAAAALLDTRGSASSSAASTATATATGIELGAGGDRAVNNGDIAVTSDATAHALNVSIDDNSSSTGAKEKVAATIGGGATATARAVGIGGDAQQTTLGLDHVQLFADGEDYLLRIAVSKSHASGDDDVTNHAAIDATATAAVKSGGVGAATGVKGSAGAAMTSKAEAEAAAVDLGGGNDTLVNEETGALRATATADAVALTGSIVAKSEAGSKQKVSSATKGSVNATAEATGIAADNLAADTSYSLDATAHSPETGASTFSIEVRELKARAAGDDVVDNAGTVDVEATASTTSIGASLAMDGKAAAKTSSTAEATAAGVDLGAGEDVLNNLATGVMTATATATAVGVNVAIGSKTSPSAKGDVESTVEGSVKAQARATGVSGDAMEGNVERSVTVALDEGALRVAVARVESRVGGNDDIDNDGAITAATSATSFGGGGGLVVEGETSVAIKSSADARSAGVDLGGGDDRITNDGTLVAQSVSSAAALDVAVAVPGDPAATSKPKVATEGGATSTAVAVGLAGDSVSGDASFTLSTEFRGSSVTSITSQTVDLSQTETRASGDDDVTNTAGVDAHATALTSTGGVGVTIDGGSAAAASEAKAGATAVAVDLGGGADRLTNTATATLDVTATSTAEGINFAFATKSSETDKEKVSSAAGASVEATATAAGISADSLLGDTSLVVNIAIDEVANVSVRQSETRPGGNDDVLNDAQITAVASATAEATGAGITLDGKATAKAESTAEGRAAGIDLGGGDDGVINTGRITATATGDAWSTNLVAGVSGGSSSSKTKSTTSAEGDAKGEATAIGLSADGLVGDTTTDFTLAADLTTFVIAADYRKAESRAAGNDEVTNHGDIEARATATTTSLGGGLTVKGAAWASSKASADAVAAGIDLGGGADTLTNTGDLVAVAESRPTAIKATISTEGKAIASDGFWKGGIKADAKASGIDGSGAMNEATIVEVDIDPSDRIVVRYETREDDSGADASDDITNRGSLDVRAIGVTGSGNVAISAEGLAGAVSHVESAAEAVGIRAGEGEDRLLNLGAATSLVEAAATASSVKVAVSGKGAAVAADALWDTGTKAEATAIGLDGGNGTTEVTSIVGTVDDLTVSLVHEETESDLESGADTITNEQRLEVAARSTAPSLGVALEAKKGVAAAVSAVGSESEATAVRGGGGADSITNLGVLKSEAEASAEAANIAIAESGFAAATDSVWDGGTDAKATAIGIDGDGGSSTVKRITLTVNALGATIAHEKIETAGTGNDTIVNEAEVTAKAKASPISTSIAATVKGVSAAVSGSTAETEAAAIRGGDGHDEITSHGTLTAEASSKAEATSLALTLDKGVAVAGNAVWDGGVTAKARAAGIDGDGGLRSSTTTRTLTTVGGVDYSRTVVDEAARGNDIIDNTGQITAKADASTSQISVAVAVTGVAGAVSTATAEADAQAIDAGEGDDAVDNSGTLESEAVAEAVAVNGGIVDKGVAISANDSWNGGVKADARGRGIDGGIGSDALTNAGNITARSKATAPSVAGSIAVTGLPVAVSTATATSDAAAIDGGEGADLIVNHAGTLLKAEAEALAGSASVAITNQGAAFAADAIWDGGTKAEARATGIGAGDGVDTLRNDGEVEATSDAESGSAAVSVAVSGLAGAAAVSTANTKSTALDTGDGSDVAENNGTLRAKANALALSASVGVTNSGVALTLNPVWDGGTRADAAATGLATGGGADVVDNTGAITSESDAVTGAASVSVAVSGVAGATATSTGVAQATAIDTGDGIGADRVTNSGTLDADADAVAVSTSVGVTTAGVAVGGDLWDGGTTAEGVVRGIRTGLGDDVVENTAQIEATTTATTVSAAVTVAVSGVAGAIATSTAKSDAAAIDTTEALPGLFPIDADRIVNVGALDARATSVANTASVGVTTAGVAGTGITAWDGGTTADAVATAIRSGIGNDTIDSQGTTTSTAVANANSASVSVAVAGVAGGVATSTAMATSTGIDTGSGDDSVVTRDTPEADTGAITSDAVAVANAATVAVTTAGVAIAADSFWDGGTTATSAARGLDTGADADRISNSTAIDASSTSTTVSAAVSVAVWGVAGAIANATGDSEATAIVAGTGADHVANTAMLTADADAVAVSAAVGYTTGGLSVAGNSSWDGGTTADARAKGIAAGEDGDIIHNSGAITADAGAVADSTSVSVAVFGVSGVVSTATGKALASAIDAGDGDDVIVNDQAGTLTAIADAKGVAVNVSGTAIGASVAADAFWDGGTKAEANASGIDGGSGADVIVNAAAITSTADSDTASIAASIAGIGVAAAIATSTSTATAAAIRGGEGADDVHNTGNLTSVSTAHGTGVAASVSGVGIAVAGDAFWDGGTKAEAHASGIDGDEGDDRITNVADTLAAEAISTTNSVSVSLTIGGLSGAAAGSTSTARATVLDGDEGDDTITTAGALDSTAHATATGVSVALSGAGGAVAGSHLDTATSAESVATGIAGGAGADSVTAGAASAITLTSTAESTDVAVAVTIGTDLVSFASADASAQAVAKATGLEGGAGDDTLTNVGDVTGTLDATMKARAVTVSGSHAKGNASGLAEAVGIGLDGGEGDDAIDNRGTIELASDADASGQTVTVSIVGAAGSDATGTARATLAGLAGGNGADSIVNSGVVTLTPTATAEGQNVGVNVAGASVNDASAIADARAIGMDGGEGADALVNSGALNGTVVANTTARSTGIVIAGASLNASNATAETTATGIAGGIGDDLIRNAADGTIELAANAGTTADAVTIGVVGATSGEAEITSMATAAGIEAGEGDDEALNQGDVLVRASADGFSRNSTTQIVGSSGSRIGTTIGAIGHGMTGGKGADLLINFGRLDVGAASTATADGSSWTLAGGASGDTAMNATAHAAGLAGDGGADRIRNSGTLLVDADASMTTSGDGSSAIFGGAKSDTQLSAASSAAGLSGGRGADVIDNIGIIEITGDARLTSSKTSVSFAGSPSADALLSARIGAAGVDGGDDDDVVFNDGRIDLSVKAVADITGGAGATIGGDTTANGVARADATAHGLDGGGGHDRLETADRLTVLADTDAVVATSSAAGFFFSEGATAASADTLASATGVAGGDGDNLLRNTGETGVTANSSGYGFAYAVGGTFAFEGDATATSEADARATATGMSAAHGANVVLNAGRLIVSAKAITSRELTTTAEVCEERFEPQAPICTPVLNENGEVVGETCEEQPDLLVKSCGVKEIPKELRPTYAAANGNGASGDGVADATASATAESAGINVGDGGNTIRNEHLIDVRSVAMADATTFADGDLAGNATATSVAMAESTAAAIVAGHGDNTIVNTGSLNVLAEPRADAAATASGGDICIWYLFGTWCGGGGEGDGASHAQLTATADGILVGDGNNLIVNSGSIEVKARGDLSTSVSSANDASHRRSVLATATGVRTGDGNNVVVNTESGAIAVEAWDAQVDAACTGGGCRRLAEAVGIQTGSGDDVIVNDGTITTTRFSLDGTSHQGIAIDAGAGNDEVALGVGSTTVGAIQLGAGNDTFVWSAGVSMSDTVEADAGQDVFALGGHQDDQFALSKLDDTFHDFELFEKRGDSTWTLVGDRRMDWTVEGGTLAIAGTIEGTVQTADGGVDARIAVLPSGTLRRDDALGPAVGLAAGGVLDNQGLVEVSDPNGLAVSGRDGARILNNAAIVSAGGAVSVSGNGTSVFNAASGVIVAAGDGLVLADGAVLVNDGLVSSTGPLGAGIVVNGDGARVVNRGAIVGLGQAAVRMASPDAASGFLVNEPTGSIVGRQAGIVGGDGNQHITNHGYVSGQNGRAIDLGAGSDVMTVTFSGRVDGVTDGGAGFDSYVLSGSTDATFDLSAVGSAITGFEIFRKTGQATWTLVGEGAGDWAVEQSALGIEGRLEGSVTLLPQTMLDVQAGGAVRRDDGRSAVVLTGAGLLQNHGLIASVGGPAVQADGNGNVVTNVGTIDTGTGAFAAAADTLSASLPGAAAAAMSLTGHDNRIVNAGRVTSTGRGFVIVGDGNQVTNTGSIEAAQAAIDVTGAAGLVVNAGSVIADGSAISFSGSGHTIVNTGVLRTGGAGTAVDGRGNNIAILNLADVRAGTGITVDGDGNSLRNGGTIQTTQSGVTLDGDRNVVVNGGRIQSGGRGISLTGDTSVITNAGSIEARGRQMAVLLAGNDTVFVNTGIVLAQGEGVVARGAGIAIENLGGVAATGPAIRLQSTAGARASLTNGIGAVVQSRGGVAVVGGDGDDRVVNLGVISGGNGVAVDLGAGADVMRLSTGASLGGAVLGGAGADTLELTGEGAIRTNLGNYVGFERLDKQDAGVWVLTGAADMSWNIAGGALYAEGDLSGAGVVGLAGRLGGSGRIGGIVNEGIVAPGSSIGTLTVAGDYEQRTGAVLEIEGWVSGASDRLAIEGRAVLGGAVMATPLPGPYGIATELGILTATGGVSGRFDSVSSTLDYLDPLLDYDPDGVRLTLIRNDFSFLSVADTANARELGAALDANKRAMAHGDFKAVMDSFLTMDGASRQASFQTLGGELHAATVRAMLHTGRRFFTAAIDRRLSAQQMQDRRRTVWSDAFSFDGRLHGDGNARSAKYGATGFAAGFETMVGDTMRLGGAMTYAPASTGLAGDTAKMRGYHPAVYGEYMSRSWSLGFGYGYGRHDVSTARAVVVGPYARVATAEYKADQHSAVVTGAFSLFRTPSALVEGIGELGYSRLLRDSFDEAGAGSLSLVGVGDEASRSLESVVGIRASWQPDVWGARMVPVLRIGWARESLDHQGGVSGALAGAAAGLFSVRSTTEARDSALVSLGMSANFARFGRAFCEYDGDFTGRGTEHGFEAGVRLSW